MSLEPNTTPPLAVLDSLTARQPLGPYRVLMVAGDSRQFEAHAALLRAAGMEVRSLSQPLQTLAVAQEFSPEVLVLAAQMPGVNGAELATALRELDHFVSLPVLFVADGAGDHRQQQALVQAGETVMAEPLPAGLLPASVAALAERRRRANAIQQRLELAMYEERKIHQALDRHAIVSITDRSGNIIHANDKFCEISGYERHELLGRNHRMIKSSRHAPEIYTQLWRTIASGQVWEGELCNRRKDGSEYWVKTTITPFFDSNGKPFQYVSIRTDVTQIKATEANLRLRTEEMLEAKNNAERASRAKSEFLSSMSHELRTPMNAILGFSQLMEYDERLPDHFRRDVHEIFRAGEHLLALINDVLDLAKIESGNILMSLEPVELGPMVEECLTLVEMLAARQEIHLSHSGILGARARADRTRLRQALLNLLSNAVKYNRKGGSVKVVVEPAGPARLRISVMDTGKGIAAEHMGELFQPFGRLDAEKTSIEGTGIGLIITKRIVELMDGQIGVESEVGTGSRFWIELPRESAEARLDANEDVAHRQVPTLQVPGRRQHLILYIEDNPSNLTLVARILGRRSHTRLLTAPLPEIGIELARTHRPDLILLDINMPGMDGFQVLEVMKTDPLLQGIPVIAVTANAMPHDIALGMAAGFVDYLTKPLDIERFNQVLDLRLAAANRD